MNEKKNYQRKTRTKRATFLAEEKLFFYFNYLQRVTAKYTTVFYGFVN